MSALAPLVLTVALIAGQHTPSAATRSVGIARAERAVRDRYPNVDLEVRCARTRRVDRCSITAMLEETEGAITRRRPLTWDGFVYVRAHHLFVVA